jgi:hypothetical protein
MTEYLYKCTVCAKTEDPCAEEAGQRYGAKVEYRECGLCERRRADQTRVVAALERIAASLEALVALHPATGNVRGPSNPGSTSMQSPQNSIP